MADGVLVIVHSEETLNNWISTNPAL